MITLMCLTLLKKSEWQHFTKVDTILQTNMPLIIEVYGIRESASKYSFTNKLALFWYNLNVMFSSEAIATLLFDWEASSKEYTLSSFHLHSPITWTNAVWRQDIENRIHQNMEVKDHNKLQKSYQCPWKKTNENRRVARG